MPDSDTSKINHFPLIILIGRPASGKSEIIHFLQHIHKEERLQRFHIADLDVLDDFPMLWTWFEEDRILEELGGKRLHTDPEGYFKHEYQYHLLIKRLELEYRKRLRDKPDYHKNTTTILEFARGSEHGGYSQALQQLSLDLLNTASVLYVNVSFAESLRKNRLRFNPNRPDSLLEHAVPDKKLHRLYFEDDWSTICMADKNYQQIGASRIPYAVFENEDDVTSASPDLLGKRLKSVLTHLWDIHISR